MDIKESIKDICRKIKITDYLEKRGVEMSYYGNKAKCRCPLPGHRDSTPSFNIITKEDGTQSFKCFGCQKWGDLLTLTGLIEGGSFGNNLRKYSRSLGITINSYVPETEQERPPLCDDTMVYFCEEDREGQRFAVWAKNFLIYSEGSEDAVNKLSKVYEELDRLTEIGDSKGIADLFKKFKNIVFNKQIAYNQSKGDQSNETQIPSK